VQPAEDGMRIDAQTLLPIATTYMYAPNALMPATLQVAVVRQERSSRVDSSLQWERCPRFVRDYVWPDNDTVRATADDLVEI